MIKVQKNEFKFRAMGTEFLFRIYSDCDSSAASVCESVATTAIARVRELENLLSEFKASSCVAKINAAEPGKAIEVSDDFATLFTISLQVRSRTNAAFDPFIKSTVKVTGADYFWNADERSFLKHDTRVKLGFGAIGKGFALDEVAKLLREAGYSSFVISAGGSSFIRSRVDGIPDEDKIFWVLEKDSEKEGAGYSGTWLQADQQRLSGSNAYSVSAEYERGKHILGVNQEAALLATLVGQESACLSDALSTAFFVAGWAGVSRWGGDTAFLSVDQQNMPAWNREASTHFKIPREWTEEA